MQNALFEMDVNVDAHLLVNRYATAKLLLHQTVALWACVGLTRHRKLRSLRSRQLAPFQDIQPLGGTDQGYQGVVDGTQYRYTVRE